jgi:hypothetical protein
MITADILIGTGSLIPWSSNSYRHVSVWGIWQWFLNFGVPDVTDIHLQRAKTNFKAITCLILGTLVIVTDRYQEHKKGLISKAG